VAVTGHNSVRLARYRLLTDRDEAQVERLCRCGVEQRIVARVMGVSERTVRRTLERRRVATAEPTLDELLAAVNDSFAAPPRSRRGRAGWEKAAAAIERMHEEAIAFGLLD
jgi:IS30 family transposase